MKLGEFRNNVAHSVKAYGLRLFHGHEPPLGHIAYYEDHLSYKCSTLGIIGASEMGRVVFRNVTLVDNPTSFASEKISLDSSEVDV